MATVGFDITTILPRSLLMESMMTVGLLDSCPDRIIRTDHEYTENRNLYRYSKYILEDE